MVDFNKSGTDLKEALLNYLRDRANESFEEEIDQYGREQNKKLARALNKQVNKTQENLAQILNQKAEKESWDNKTLLPKMLMLEHCKNIIMLESRNDVWSYDYMAFSRRIGEIWEPFCMLCFEYPIKDIELFVPPLFSEVKKNLHDEIEAYIDDLNITNEKKEELKNYYQKVWKLVASGEIKLELDLHFISEEGKKVNVDFKSGFGSNEKGNTNRLLMVATVYDNIDDEDYECTLLVRSVEDENNNYFQTLKNSNVWNAYCGADAYDNIFEYSGFNLQKWIKNNIEWEDDFRAETLEYFKEKNLFKYLTW